MNKYKFLVAFLALFCVFPITNAQTQNQQASVSIEAGNTYARFEPENFSIGPLFIDKSIPTTKIYKTLPPGLYEKDLTAQNLETKTIPNQFVFEEAKGDKFNITISISNLIDNDKVIPYENISIVSLSESETGLDSFNENSPKSNTVGINSPITCANWNNDIKTNCIGEFEANTFLSETVINHPLDPTINISETTMQIPIDQSSNYQKNEVIQFQSGEKALILQTTPDNTHIIVRRGILGTTASTQEAQSGINCFGTNSKPIDLVNAETFENRIGSYSTGFGFLFNILNTTFEAGSYKGTLTFTILFE